MFGPAQTDEQLALAMIVAEAAINLRLLARQAISRAAKDPEHAAKLVNLHLPWMQLADPRRAAR